MYTIHLKTCMVTKKSMESNRSPLSGSKNANFYVFNLLFTCPLPFALTTAGTAGEITFNTSDLLFARPMQISPLTTTAYNGWKGIARMILIVITLAMHWRFLISYYVSSNIIKHFFVSFRGLKRGLDKWYRKMCGILRVVITAIVSTEFMH